MPSQAMQDLTAPGTDASRVLLREYRLAPEHPFPAAIDDVVAAWRWLRTGQGLSASSIAVAGDSAGGGLAVALLVAARDAGEALPAAAGVDVSLEVGNGLPHVYQLLLGTPEAAEATERIGKFLRARVCSPGSQRQQ